MARSFKILGRNSLALALPYQLALLASTSRALTPDRVVPAAHRVRRRLSEADRLLVSIFLSRNGNRRPGTDRRLGHRHWPHRRQRAVQMSSTTLAGTQNSRSGAAGAGEAFGRTAAAITHTAATGRLQPFSMGMSLLRGCDVFGDDGEQFLVCPTPIRRNAPTLNMIRQEG